jgi:quercetin dioxygenase-like cupin family protein
VLVSDMTRPTYPQFIKNLPRIKHSMEGVEGWLAQGKDFQIVFFEIEPTAIVPAHSHSAQFGVVMEGEIALTIGDETRNYAKGDTYSIPEGVVHHAKFNSFALVMDFFAEPDRYEVV